MSFWPSFSNKANIERDFEKVTSEKEENNIIKQQQQDEIHQLQNRLASMEKAAHNDFEEKNELRTKLIQERGWL